MQTWVRPLVWLYVLSFFSLSAQSDSSKKYVILLGRYEFSEAIGFALGMPGAQRIDSERMRSLGHWDAASVLSFQTGAQVRSYGPGSLSSVSFRGLGAGRTALIWEGMPLNYLSAGQADFSILPSAALQNMQVLEGGEAGRWGSGGSGGLVLVETSAAFLRESSWAVEWGLQARSFGGIAGRWGFHREGRKSRGYVYFSQQWAQNNFEFQDFSVVGFPTVEQRNNRYFKNDVVAGYALKVRKMVAAWHAWISQAQREIPAAMGSQHQEARQSDLSIRLVQRLDWEPVANVRIMANLGLVTDSLVYRQQGLESEFRSLAGHLRLEARWRALRWMNALLGYEQSAAWASQTNYPAGLAPQHFFSPYALLEMNPGKWKIHYSLRLPMSVEQVLKPVGSLYVGYGFSKKHWRIQPGIAYREHYRWPSLNDLYWNPGGNAQLKPETGYTLDAQLEMVWKRENQQISWTSKAYMGALKNYLLWLPMGNVWQASQRPEAVQHGVSNRVEWKGIGGMAEFNGWLQHNWQYAGEGAGANRWAYVPAHQAQGGMQMESGLGKGPSARFRMGGMLMGQYTSERFTSEDQVQALGEYVLVDLGIQARIKRAEGNEIKFGLSCHNLFDERYETVFRRPQPGRHFSLNLTFTLQSKP
jgi:iron complex outermembrane receptor protein